MKITAAIAREPDQDFELGEIELDEPREDEILVRIHGVGICHSDLAARDQHIPTTLPAVLGHEGAGVVERVGSSVTRVIAGDRVILTFHSCGDCVSCQRGAPAYCTEFRCLNTTGQRLDGSCSMHEHGQPIRSNFFSQSSFATYALCYERNVVKVPVDIPLHLLGPLGCGVQTGVGAIMRSLACRAGSSILITGGGSVGLSAVLGAVIQGCSTIIVSELMASRRSLALELGATHVINPADGNLVEAVRALEPGGIDYAFDTTGRPEIVEAAIATLGKCGAIGMVGVPASNDASITLGLRSTVGRGLTIRGVVEGDSEPQIFIPQMIELYRAGRLPFDKFITTYRFEDINQAIHDQSTGKTVKAVLLTAAAFL
jgi:aryl-alcohol dehydrogenase